MTAADLDAHDRLGIAGDMLDRAHVRRVTDAEARDVGIGGTGDLSGVVYPYRDLLTSQRRSWRGAWTPIDVSMVPGAGIE